MVSLTVQTSPRAWREDTPHSPLHMYASVLLSASGSTVSPLEPYPAPSGPLLTSILTPPFSCKGPATSQMERPLAQKSTLSALAGNVGQVKSLVRVPIY